jgi:hypothetical protein
MVGRCLRPGRRFGAAPCAAVCQRRAFTLDSLGELWPWRILAHLSRITGNKKAQVLSDTPIGHGQAHAKL